MENKKLKDIQFAINIFGFGYSMYEYKFLYNKWEFWISEVIPNGKVETEFLKTFCVVSLEADKAWQIGNLELYVKLSKYLWKMEKVIYKYKRKNN